MLRRLAETTGGSYVPAADAAPGPVAAARAAAGKPAEEMRDLWHNGWSLLAIVALLAAEWIAATAGGAGVMTAGVMTQVTKPGEMR